MEKKISLLTKYLIESINNYGNYKNKFQKLFLSIKENQKYLNVISKYFDIEKDENYFQLYFLLFHHHKKFINPNNVNFGKYHEHFKITKNNIHDDLERNIIKLIDNNNIMKLYFYWHVYILIILSEIFHFNESINNDFSSIDIENILYQNNNKIINLYYSKKVKIPDLFIFLYIYLFCLEDFSKNSSHENNMKLINNIILNLLFDLLEKISKIIFSETKDLEEFKSNVQSFFSFLEELKSNEFILNDYNLIILLDGNIIQNFMLNLLKSINPKILESVFPLYLTNLTDFFAIFLKFRFNKSKLMDFFLNNIKNGLINLKYLSEQQGQVTNDVFLINFQSDLIQKIFTYEDKNLAQPKFNSFLFNGKSSKISFNIPKLSLNDNLIIFSFLIKSNFNEINSYNSNQPLFCFYNEKNEIIFKISIKKIEESEEDKKVLKFKKNNIKNKFALIININKQESILKEFNNLEPNITYFIAIHLNISFLNIYLYPSFGINSKLISSHIETKFRFSEEKLLLNLGFDNYQGRNDFFSGYIGYFHILQLYNINKNKIDYDNNKVIIEYILSLKYYYKYIIYYLKNAEYEYKMDYSLDYLSHYKNKNDIGRALKTFEFIKKESKNFYKVNLFLSPELFKLSVINEKKDIKFFSIPTISGICEKQKEYKFNNLNITCVRYENSKEIFLMKNGLNFFCFQIEYLFQFGNYYALFKNKNRIDSSFIDNESEDSFFEENKETCLKLIKSSINNILLILPKYIIDLKITNFFTELKQIFSALLAAIKILSEMGCIIESIFHQISNIFIIICEQISITHNNNKDEKNKNEDDENIIFFISFRDSIIDILLTKEYYYKSSPKFFESFFDKIYSVIESNNVKNVKDITLSHPNIILKAINFSELLNDYFLNFDPNSKNKKGNNMTVYSYFKLIKGLINGKKNNTNNKNNKSFKRLVSYVLKDNHDNYYQNYAFFTVINDLINEGFSLDEDDINKLIQYFFEISTDKPEESKENNISNQCTIIISILMNCIFEKKNNKSFYYFCNEIKQIDLNEKLISFIINGIINIFPNYMDNRKGSNNNINNYINRKPSNDNNKEVDNRDSKLFFEDLFEFLLIIIKKTKKDINLDNIQNEYDENNKLQSIDNNLKTKEQDAIMEEIIGFLFFIDEMINAHINNDSVNITTIYCLLNLIKLIHIIVFDDKLIELFKEDKFLILFKSMIESCIKTKILLTNLYLHAQEKPSSILKTIPEIILDILIELIKSDIIKNIKEGNKTKEILTKNDLIQRLNDIFLIERKMNNQKDNEENKKSLFIYNDLYRYIFSKKITNVDNELKSINKNKIIMKYFPKFEKDFIYLNRNNYLFSNQERKFNFNFVTFNLEKIYKYKYNTDSQEFPELSSFFDILLNRLIKDQEILYQIDKIFFFKPNSEYPSYNSIKNQCEKMLLNKKFDFLDFRNYLELNFSQKVLVSDFITSGLCENIKDSKKKLKYYNQNLNKSFTEIPSKEEKNKKNNSFINTYTFPKQINYESKSVQNDDNHSVGSFSSSELSIEEGNIDNNENNNNDNNNEPRSPSETSSNLSPDSINSDALSASCNIQSNTKNIRPFYHMKSNSNYSILSAISPDSKININKNYIDSSSSTTILNKKNKLEEDINCTFLNKLDSLYLFNVKRDLMKNIFSLNFLEPIFYDKTFITLKKIYYQMFGNSFDQEIKNNINLNYPTKIMNFSNGLEPNIFLKPYNKFYEHKTFHVSHNYYNDYITKNKIQYKNEQINLFQKQVLIPEKEKTSTFNCELIKINHPIYGIITYSKSVGCLFFEQNSFKDIYNTNINTYEYEGFFSWSTIKYKEKENQKMRNVQSNKLFHNKKKLIIFISEIEEIVERRFLFLWQGLEIYLKDGRSFFFNLLSIKNFLNFRKYLLDNDAIKPIFHKKEFLTKNKNITVAWEKDNITTYEYILLINKYSSRSYNDPNQYYIFPWLLTKFDNIIKINKKQNILLKEKLNNNNKEICEEKDDNLLNCLRDFKYPLSLQTETSRNFAIYRYIENNETNYQYHLGTHYSTSPFIFYYLMRQEPYSSLLIKLQNYQQENPNRMFTSLEDTIDILQTGNDNRELIPEFYSKIEYFINLNYSYFGKKATNKIVNNVNIDFIKNTTKSDVIISDYIHFIVEHRKLLNCDLINSSINDWINIIFGVGQFPSDKKNHKNCCNIYRKESYEDKMNLSKKIDKYKKSIKKKYNNKLIRTKIMNKMNLIISFGQTPYQVFKESHRKKDINIDSSEQEDVQNSLSYNKQYNLEENNETEEDDFTNFSKFFKTFKFKSSIIFPCISFEINNSNNKIFALAPNGIVDINFIFNHNESEIMQLRSRECINIPRIKLFENFTQNGIEYYVYKPKYSFSSFTDYEYSEQISRKSSKISQDSKSKNFNISDKNFNFNHYYKNLFENIFLKQNTDIKQEENYKFIQCRYLDNSFKIYKVIRIKSNKKKEKDITTILSFSFICEDFVSSCCTISSNQFLIGLDNGKLIRWNIINEEKDKMMIKFDKNIQAHRGRINAIEIDQRLGLIITCGKDNLVQIRKLYNLELILPISIKKKYVVTMAKVSPINLLYIMCFDIKEKKSIIYGYTLTGIKFAKTKGGLYCNIDFTRNGNIVSLLNNKELCILNSYDLTKQEILNEQVSYKLDKQDLDELKEIEGSIYLEYHYFIKKPNSNSKTKINNSIVYIKKEKDKNKNDYLIFYYDFKENKIFE